MENVIVLREKMVEKKHKEMFQVGSAAYKLREENTYWKKPNKTNIDVDQVRKDLTKGYMALLSK